ncbi:MAG: NVEALA domain-containing protein [Bacteroidales bacterium]|nr:NVEALA domain-containing protein [Bacteroidales bacterium]
MKKKLLCGIAAVAIAATIAFNMSLNANSNNLSDLSLANVEALTEPEVTVSSPGNWSVIVVSDDNWICYDGGRVCCPEYHSASC